MTRAARASYYLLLVTKINEPLKLRSRTPVCLHAKLSCGKLQGERRVMLASRRAWLPGVLLAVVGCSYGEVLDPAESDHHDDASGGASAGKSSRAGAGAEQRGGSGGCTTCGSAGAACSHPSCAMPTAGAGGTSGTANDAGSGSTASGGVAGSAGTPGDVPSECAITRPSASGDEPNGVIPVCCTPSSEQRVQIQQVFELLNEHRADNGVAPLTYDLELEAAIQGHCQHMSGHTFFSHDAPESSVRSAWTRAALCGTEAAGENIAAGQRTPADVMDDWKNSSGHNENMLNRSFARVGIGLHGRNWGQLFGR